MRSHIFVLHDTREIIDGVQLALPEDTGRASAEDSITPIIRMSVVSTFSIPLTVEEKH